MELKNKALMLFFFLVILLFFSFGFYLFWQPDRLRAFIPENSFLYLHLNLDNSQRIGRITNQWLNRQEINDFLSREFSQQNLINEILKKENIKFLSEIGLVGLKTKNNFFSEKKFVFLVRTKKWIDEDKLIKGTQNLFVKKIDQRTYLISQESISLTKSLIDFLPKQKNFSFTNLSRPVLRGFFIPGFWQKGFEKSDNLIELKAFSLNPKGLMFSFDPSFSNSLNSLDLTKTIFSKTRAKNSFVLIYPLIGDFKNLKERIKIFLALQNPLEQKKFLPDKTAFTELIVDPQKFVFQEQNIKEKRVYYWSKESSQEKGLNKLVFWQEKNYFFISNNLSLSEKVINNSTSINLSFQEPGFQRGFYMDLNEKGVKSIFLVESTTKIKGYLFFQL